MNKSGGEIRSTEQTRATNTPKQNVEVNRRVHRFTTTLRLWSDVVLQYWPLKTKRRVKKIKKKGIKSG